MNTQAPETATPLTDSDELAVLEIWRDVLERDDIGPDDDFFDLDGTSMHAIRVIHRVSDEFNVTLRALDFFESPTVAAMAATITAHRSSASDTIPPRPLDADPVLSFDQQHLWLVDQIVPGNAYNIHGRRRLLGDLDVAALSASIRGIMQRHETLRTRLPDIDGEPIQVVDDLDPDWTVPIVDVETADDPLVAAIEVADAEALNSFTLAEGPLFRCALIRLSDSDHVLSVTAHHTVCDDWSVAIFIRELSALYEVDGDLQRADLPELAIQYRDYAVWQQQRLTSDLAERQLGYWKQHLDGAYPEITLPLSTGVDTTHPGAITRTLTSAESQALHELCRENDVTFFIALLAGFGAALGDLSGQDDVVVGVPVTGRAQSATKDLIGLFVSTLPLRLDLRGDPSLPDLLGRARETVLGAHANSDVPLEMIVRHVQPERPTGRAPIFQVMLNVVDRPTTTGFGNLDEVAMDGPPTPSKLDLILNVRQIDGTAELEFEFDVTRYDDAQVARLLELVLNRLVATAAG